MIRFGKRDGGEASTLNRIKNMSLSGYTTRQIAKQLNNDGDASRFGKPWCFQTVARILALEKNTAPTSGLISSLQDMLQRDPNPAGTATVMTDSKPGVDDMVFVFGSNEAGVHGAGAALDAVTNHGAIMGQGLGRQGQSYAIATKGKYTRRDGTPGIGRTLPLDVVKGYVEEFIRYAEANPTENFKITQIGCGYAGFTADQMAPLFVCVGNTDNCYFDSAWEPYLGITANGKPVKYWGTF